MLNGICIKKQDPWLAPEKITLCPNAIEIQDTVLTSAQKHKILEKYGIPDNKLLFIYGGGLGKPQGIEFLIKCIREASQNDNLFFVIVGTGLYFDSLKNLEKELPNSLKTIKWLPTNEYEQIIQSCDVGLVMLNHAFKIPNFPSRILLYMQSHLPILAATDVNTDVGRIAEENGFGYWCESNDVKAFVKLSEQFQDAEKRKQMGEKSYEYLCSHYSVGIVADQILNRIGQRR